MSSASERRGGTAVGMINDYDGIEAAAVIYLRMWFDGPQERRNMHEDLRQSLGAAKAGKAFQALGDLFSLCATHGRRPLMRHSSTCKCVGADEACFARFICAAAEGEREDAMLIATLIVRPDVAPIITALATDFGLALKQMNLAALKVAMPQQYVPSTLH